MLLARSFEDDLRCLQAKTTHACTLMRKSRGCSPSRSRVVAVIRSFTGLHSLVQVIKLGLRINICLMHGGRNGFINTGSRARVVTAQPSASHAHDTELWTFAWSQSHENNRIGVAAIRYHSKRNERGTQNVRAYNCMRGEGGSRRK